ncbi:MAG: hypothetical protein PHW73_07190 [Atribacterota bacterium]|nr:hypothetical protein [Atribacterota bacterium]
MSEKAFRRVVSGRIERSFGHPTRDGRETLESSLALPLWGIHKERVLVDRGTNQAKGVIIDFMVNCNNSISDVLLSDICVIKGRSEDNER